mmetsp:Transcript_86124/g.196506  ORF Transcript_86124/g.196506 Transcript_86124/m.196506 type:complete len:418 (-) Transcript_86124:1636-2889(-)
MHNRPVPQPVSLRVCEDRVGAGDVRDGRGLALPLRGHQPGACPCNFVDHSGTHHHAVALSLHQRAQQADHRQPHIPSRARGQPTGRHHPHCHRGPLRQRCIVRVGAQLVLATVQHGESQVHGGGENGDVREEDTDLPWHGRIHHAGHWVLRPHRRELHHATRCPPRVHRLQPVARPVHHRPRGQRHPERPRGLQPARPGGPGVRPGRHDGPGPSEYQAPGTEHVHHRVALVHGHRAVTGVHVLGEGQGQLLALGVGLRGVVVADYAGGQGEDGLERVRVVQGGVRGSRAVADWELPGWETVHETRAAEGKRLRRIRGRRHIHSAGPVHVPRRPGRPVHKSERTAAARAGRLVQSDTIVEGGHEGLAGHHKGGRLAIQGGEGRGGGATGDGTEFMARKCAGSGAVVVDESRNLQRRRR